jgi:hypothetical protein
MSPDLLAKLRGEVDALERPPAVPWGAAPEVVGAINKRHHLKQAAQSELRSAISLWAGWQRSLGRPDSETYRRFFFAHGLDVLTAQALPAREAAELTAKIQNDLTSNGVTNALA